MSQSAPGTGVATALAPAAAPSTAPPATAAPSAPAAVPVAPRRGAPLSTPRRLQLLSGGLVALGVLVALAGVLTFGLLVVVLDRADADTEQLVRVQSIQTSLLSADATATNAFLVGGLEPAAQRATYDEAMSTTSGLIAEAAQAQPADAAALAVLNRQVLDYDAAIERARANNRQGFPVGAQYLRGASAQLRSAALPVLDELVAANAERAGSRMRVGGGAVFPVVVGLALVGLVLAQVWLARRFHRRINPGVLAASAVLLVALLVSVVGLVRLADGVRSIRAGSFADVNAAAGARIGANDAKANESLTLVARGSGGAFEKAWTASAGRVDEQLAVLGSGPLQTGWRRCTETHQQIRALDDGGRWDQAVALATGTGEEQANGRFAVVDAGLAEELASSGAATGNALAGRLPGLVTAAVLSLLAGVAVALLGRRGIATRLREYR
ncbi:hypothetical protein SAMN04488543_2544 [Friedmanniella luteola]|uniref:Four helix bundle sensory module for signal transduction n=1 Tax=Friedmanniella luteola TaxID=546871 RepID=A0A1H1VPW2_9ACTN|nr:hypothetical protein [Friedmanniella luteola]SDS86725.1 hypothetical protein SAMN04488543_2544 [Friedmanniella luteola]